MTLANQPDIFRVKRIDIFQRAHSSQNAAGVDLWRQRRLHENAMDWRAGILLRPGVEPRDQFEKRVRGRRRRQAMELAFDANALASRLLVADIHLARRIVADQNRRETRHDVICRNKLGYLRSEFLLNRRRERFAIEKLCGHEFRFRSS